ncbi:hypothetical protein MTO96_046125, partial [Rhipicephalus appendiculatus]
ASSQVNGAAGNFYWLNGELNWTASTDWWWSWLDEMALNALDEDIRQYVQAVNYLRWGETNFQERLLRSLPKRDAKRKIIVEGSR